MAKYDKELPDRFLSNEINSLLEFILLLKEKSVQNEIGIKFVVNNLKKVLSLNSRLNQELNVAINKMDFGKGHISNNVDWFKEVFYNITT